MAGSQRLLHHRQYLRSPRLRFQALVCTGDAGGAGLWQCVSMMPYAHKTGWTGDVPANRMDRRIKFICPFDLAEHQGVEPWHRSPGLSHFEFYPLRSTQWNIVEVIRLYRKIQTIEITLKISSKSERSRLHADLNPLEKSAKNPPKREN